MKSTPIKCLNSNIYSLLVQCTSAILFESKQRLTFFFAFHRTKQSTTCLKLFWLENTLASDNMIRVLVILKHYHSLLEIVVVIIVILKYYHINIARAVFSMHFDLDY